MLLGTGIIILPQRNPLVSAKQIASLDVPLTAETLQAYGAAGVDRLIVYPLPMENEAAIDEFLTAQAAVVLG